MNDEYLLKGILTPLANALLNLAVKDPASFRSSSEDEQKHRGATTTPQARIQRRCSEQAFPEKPTVKPKAKLKEKTLSEVLNSPLAMVSYGFPACHKDESSDDGFDHYDSDDWVHIETSRDIDPKSGLSVTTAKEDSRYERNRKHHVPPNDAQLAFQSMKYAGRSLQQGEYKEAGKAVADSAFKAAKGLGTLFGSGIETVKKITATADDNRVLIVDPDGMLVKDPFKYGTEMLYLSSRKTTELPSFSSRRGQGESRLNGGESNGTNVTRQRGEVSGTQEKQGPGELSGTQRKQERREASGAKTIRSRIGSSTKLQRPEQGEAIRTQRKSERNESFGSTDQSKTVPWRRLSNSQAPVQHLSKAKAIGEGKQENKKEEVLPAEPRRNGRYWDWSSSPGKMAYRELARSLDSVKWSITRSGSTVNPNDEVEEVTPKVKGRGRCVTNAIPFANTDEENVPEVRSKEKGTNKKIKAQANSVISNKNAVEEKPAPPTWPIAEGDGDGKMDHALAPVAMSLSKFKSSSLYLSEERGEERMRKDAKVMEKMFRDYMKE